MGRKMSRLLEGKSKYSGMSNNGFFDGRTKKKSVAAARQSRMGASSGRCSFFWPQTTLRRLPRTIFACTSYRTLSHDLPHQRMQSPGRFSLHPLRTTSRLNQHKQNHSVDSLNLPPAPPTDQLVSTASRPLTAHCLFDSKVSREELIEKGQDPAR